jgi:hypothetical protein
LTLRKVPTGYESRLITEMHQLEQEIAASAGAEEHGGKAVQVPNYQETKVITGMRNAGTGQSFGDINLNTESGNQEDKSRGETSQNRSPASKPTQQLLKVPQIFQTNRRSVSQRQNVVQNTLGSSLNPVSLEVKEFCMQIEA